jgi:hypothetical protein
LLLLLLPFPTTTPTSTTTTTTTTTTNGIPPLPVLLLGGLTLWLVGCTGGIWNLAGLSPGSKDVEKRDDYARNAVAPAVTVSRCIGLSGGGLDVDDDDLSRRSIGPLWLGRCVRLCVCRHRSITWQNKKLDENRLATRKKQVGIKGARGGRGRGICVCQQQQQQRQQRCSAAAPQVAPDMGCRLRFVHGAAVVCSDRASKTIGKERYGPRC